MFRETSHVNHAQRLNHSVVLSSPWLQLVVHSFTYHPSTHPPNTSRYITACDEFIMPSPTIVTNTGLVLFMLQVLVSSANKETIHIAFYPDLLQHEVHT